VLEPGAAQWGLLRFRDANDQLLSEAPLPFRPLRLERPGAQDMPLSIIGRTVAFPARTSKIEVVRHLEKGAERVVFVRQISATVPTVTVDEPNGAQHRRGERLTITWHSNDRDGDALIHTVLVSVARSTNWWPVAVHLEGHSVTIETTGLSEGSYRLKVQAADGVHVGESAEAKFQLY